jgi:N-formylglutamate amidohydrolase
VCACVRARCDDAYVARVQPAAYRAALSRLVARAREQHDVRLLLDPYRQVIAAVLRRQSTLTRKNAQVLAIMELGNEANAHTTQSSTPTALLAAKPTAKL